MTDWAPPIEKVTALITRPGPHGADGPELLVFEHPRGDVQLPAGTVEVGEPFEVAALREAWEETGALGLEMVGEVGSWRLAYPGERGALVHGIDVAGRRLERGWHLGLIDVDGDGADIEMWEGTRLRAPTSSVAREEDRRLFHVRSTVEMPDEWWVVTPDGDGLTWRCCWVPLVGVPDLMGSWQREWLDAARARIDTSRDAPPRARPPLPPELRDVPIWETFLAPPRGGKRFVVGMGEQDDAERCTRAHGLCVTDDGSVVVIQDADGRWDLPGGGKEPGETTVDTFVREVEEEACALVTAVAVVATLRIVELDEAGGPSSVVDEHAQLWARVELEPWIPRFETLARRLVRPREAVATTVFPPLTATLLDRAVLIDPALDWKPSSEVDR